VIGYNPKTNVLLSTYGLKILCKVLSVFITYFCSVNALLKKFDTTSFYLIPAVVLCGYYFYKSLFFEIHDFGNSYFAARMLYDGTSLFQLYDIAAFNRYVWNLGYPDVLLDFYLNSPFTPVLFYPLASIDNVLLAKAIFNGIGIILFIAVLWSAGKNYLEKHPWLIASVPILLWIPIRNQILFGQSYFIILALIFFSFHTLQKNKNMQAAVLLSLAILTKFFPALYGLAWPLKNKWKAIFYGVICSVVLIALGVWSTGPELWSYYFFDALPQAIKTGNTVDYRVNYQSMDVFLKSLFVPDAYYNPDALFDNERLYLAILWLFKSLVVGSGLYLGFSKKRNFFTVLAIAITMLFLIQSRTATYAQVLWLIPLITVWKYADKSFLKILFTVLILAIANLPFGKLGGFPIGIQFMRLWLFVVAVIVFYRSLSQEWSFKWMLYAIIILAPLHTKIFYATPSDESSYVLSQKNHFMITDFMVSDGKLAYQALGKNGLETIKTSIAVNSFDKNAVTLDNNELFLANNTQLPLSSSLKKKAVLVNDCEVYFLSDHRSRRGAFSLKKINICNLNL